MSDSGSESEQDLEDWLASKRLSKLISLLNENDIEDLSDFSALQTKEDIEQFANDLQLKIIQKNKFVAAVIDLNGIKIKEQPKQKRNEKRKRKPKRQPISKVSSDSETEEEEEESPVVHLLNEMKLSQYVSNFMDEGHDDINAWQELTMVELRNDLQMKSGHVARFIKHLKKKKTVLTPKLEPKSKNQSIPASGIVHVLLKQWNLGQYISNFIDEGYDDIEEWQIFTLDQLQEELNMKRGHARKFIKQRRTLVNKDSDCDSDSPNSDSYDYRKKRKEKRKHVRPEHSRSKKKEKHRSRKRIKEYRSTTEEESMSSKEVEPFVSLLNKWGLDRYITNFRAEAYTDIDIWHELSADDLKKELNMKGGHVRSFMKKARLMQSSNVSAVSETKTNYPRAHQSDDNYSESEGKQNSPTFSIPGVQQPIETNEQKLIRERKERRQTNMYLRGSHFVPSLNFKNDEKPHKTIMMIGATGTGKTTLLNSMMNYLYEVEYDDPYRFKLIKENVKPDGQAESQTDDVTPYILSSPILTYDLTVIDTPGFGDCRGMAHDRKITKSIKKCFETKITEIDAICFVIRAPQARLTDVQQYIFSQVLGIFGSDIKDNIFILLTFADGNEPPAVAALNSAKIPFVKYFKINNSGFSEKKINVVNDIFGKTYWDMGITAFEQFFLELHKVQTKSLTMTKQVLDRRQQLETYIEGINPVIDAGFDILDSIRDQILIIDKCSAEVDANKNFTMQMPKTRRIKKEVFGHFTTICDSCKWTCHLKCAYKNNDDKKNCSAMGDGGYCTICPNSCHWEKHFNKPYVWEAEKYYITKDIKELKNRYLDANSKKSKSDQIIDGMTDDITNNEQQLNQLIHKVRESLNELSKIALRPNVMTHMDYINKLIAAEEMTKKVGWKKRIASMHRLMKANKTIVDIQNSNFDAYKNYGGVKKYMMKKKKMKNSPQKKKTGWFKFPWT